jgi:hypothetical protein
MDAWCLLSMSWRSRSMKAPPTMNRMSLVSTLGGVGHGHDAGWAGGVMRKGVERAAGQKAKRRGRSEGGEEQAGSYR